mmetsp:Transcript_1212/g.3471  ORF Transcript_1212/g.3471 Transcript_1212/m.3471 type:complete len:388 (+) Transcript_1212:61-1224(+)
MPLLAALAVAALGVPAAAGRSGRLLPRAGGRWAGARRARLLASTPGSGGARTALDEMSADGKFERTASSFRAQVEPGGAHPPQAGRYRLYVALACPWAAGVLSALYLKGLEGVVKVSVAHPTWQRTRPDDPADAHCGWAFKAPGHPPVTSSAGHGAFECDAALAPDPAGAASVRDVYERAANWGSGGATKFTTPLLYDEASDAIVNNESRDLLRILNSAFAGLGASEAVDLFPAEAQAEAEALDAWIYPDVNDGVYKCGFARSQAAYDEASGALFAALDRLDALLATRRYLTGPRLTWLDLRLYHTLVRFDPVYHTHFKCNRRRVEDYPNLAAFVRDVYQMDAVRRSTNLRHIKVHYYSSHPQLNAFAVVPEAAGQDLDAPHGREGL